MPSIITFFRNITNPKWLLPIGCFVFCIGLFLSRAMMSIGMMTIFTTALLQPGIGNHFLSWLKQKHLLWMTIYFLFMAISFLYTENRSYGWVRMMIALPFLVLPFSFYALRNYSGIWMRWLLIGFIFLIACGNIYSLMNYLTHKEAIDASYVFSKVIPTLFQNDHIRYSLAVVLSIISGLFLMEGRKFGLREYLISACLIFSVIYIHILSAKTGILCFYIVAIIAGPYYAFQKQRRKYGILILLILITIPMISYTCFSSFRNKLSYIRYSIEQIGNSSKQTNISDEGRLLSYRFAWQAIKEHPITGVGIGDVMDEMRSKYEVEIPGAGLSVLLPHNQFLMAWMSGGIFMLVSLTLFTWHWLKKMWRAGIYHVMVFLVLAIPMLFEPLFETQYGAGLFVFFLLLWEKMEEKKT